MQCPAAPAFAPPSLVVPVVTSRKPFKIHFMQFFFSQVRIPPAQSVKEKLSRKCRQLESLLQSCLGRHTAQYADIKGVIGLLFEVHSDVRTAIGSGVKMIVHIIQDLRSPLPLMSRMLRFHKGIIAVSRWSLSLFLTPSLCPSNPALIRTVTEAQMENRFLMGLR